MRLFTACLLIGVLAFDIAAAMDYVWKNRWLEASICVGSFAFVAWKGSEWIARGAP